MRLLADENIEQPVVEALRAAGHDVACVAEAAPGADDEAVLALASAELRLLLTNDKDFGELAYRKGQSSQGIVLIRLDTQDGLEKAARLPQILSSLEGRLEDHFAIVTEHRVRLRPSGGSNRRSLEGDRLVMVLTGATSIRDVILFPQMRPEGG